MALEGEIAALVRQHLTSVWAVEMLLLMRRDPGRRWSVDELVREMRASTLIIHRNLKSYAQSGLVVVEEDGRYRFAPASPLLAQMCEEVEAAYRERPVAVINLISAPEHRLQELADAFKLRGGDT